MAALRHRTGKVQLLIIILTDSCAEAAEVAAAVQPLRMEDMGQMANIQGLGPPAVGLMAEEEEPERYSGMVVPGGQQESQVRIPQATEPAAAAVG